MTSVMMSAVAGPVLSKGRVAISDLQPRGACWPQWQPSEDGQDRHQFPDPQIPDLLHTPDLQISDLWRRCTDPRPTEDQRIESG